MPQPKTDTPPSPASLRPDKTEDTTDPSLGKGYIPDIVSRDQGKSVTQRALDDWNKYKLATGADETSGRVSKLVWVPDKEESGYGGLDSIGGSSGGGGGEYKWMPDPEGQQLFERLRQIEAGNKEFLSESGAGAGRSYVETEEDKQDEVTRQFKDFLARAKGTYDLMADEQEYGMNADDQNAQNTAAYRKGLIPGASFYTKPTMGEALSGIIRPSLPNYLSPDYRMNDAVGLGGGEGFNDPDYDEYGMPMYAFGTDAAADPALASVPPALLEMVGKEVSVPVKPPPPGFSWPWKVAK